MSSRSPWHHFSMLNLLRVANSGGSTRRCWTFDFTFRPVSSNLCCEARDQICCTEEPRDIISSVARHHGNCELIFLAMYQYEYRTCTVLCKKWFV